MKPRGWRPELTDKLGRMRGLRWRGQHKVPPHAHPLVQQFFRLLNEDGALQTELCARAGLSTQTTKGWRVKSPQLLTFEAALNTLGYRLAIVPLAAAEGLADD
jgi:hypothetical protein